MNKTRKTGQWKGQVKISPDFDDEMVFVYRKELQESDLVKRIKKICEQNNVSLKAWIEIESELDTLEELNICEKCGDIRFKQ